MVLIDNIDDPKIEFYKNLRFTPDSHTENSVFIAEGERVVLRILQSSSTIVSIFTTREFLDKYFELITSKVNPDSILIAEKSLMQQIVGFRLHSGIMSISKIPEDTQPSVLTTPIIILNNIVSAENVGSIVRNAAAFGFKSLIVDEKSCSPYLRRAVRVSMGNIIDLKFFHSKSIIKTIQELKNINLRIVSAEITENSVSIDDCSIPGNSAIIFGNEGWGIEPDLLELSDLIVSIPIEPSVPSLNVASSSAILLREISKQIKEP